MLQDAPNSALRNVLRGRFAAPQDKGASFLGQALIVTTRGHARGLRPAFRGRARVRSRWSPFRL